MKALDVWLPRAALALVALAGVFAVAHAPRAAVGAAVIALAVVAAAVLLRPGRTP